MAKSFEDFLSDYAESVKQIAFVHNTLQEIPKHILKNIKKKHKNILKVIDDLGGLDLPSVPEELKKEIEGVPPYLLSVARFIKENSENRKDFLREVIAPIARSVSADYAHIALQEYIKEPSAMYNIYKKTKLEPGSQELKNLAKALGGALGIEVCEHVAASIGLERLAHVKAYVAAGCNIKDIKDYRQNQKDPDFKLKFPTVSDYIGHRINTTAKKIHIRHDRNNGFLTAIIVDAGVDNHVFDRQDTEGAYTSDSAYMNEETKEIHYCQATLGTLGDSEKQLEGSYLIKKAVENTINSGHEDLNGFTVHSHLLHGGFIPVKMALRNTNEKSAKYIGSEFIKNLTSTGKINDDDLSFMLNTYSLLYYLGGSNPSPLKTLSLLESNLSSLGCDTLDIHEKRESALLSTNKLDNFGLFCLAQIEKVSDILAQKTDLSLNDRGAKHLHLLLGDLISAAQNHLINFSIDENSDVFKKTVPSLLKISKNFSQIRSRMSSQTLSVGRSEIPNQLFNVSLLLGSEANVREMSKNKYLFKDPVFSQDQYSELVDKYDPRINDVKLFHKLADEDLPPLIEKSMKRGNFEFLKYYLEYADSVDLYIPLTIRNKIIPSLLEYSVYKNKENRFFNKAKNEILNYKTEESMKNSLKYFWNNIENYDVESQALWLGLVEEGPLVRMFKGVGLSECLRGEINLSENGLEQISHIFASAIAYGKNNDLLKSLQSCSKRTYKKSDHPRWKK